MVKAEISTIEEEFEKSQVKAHIRTRKGKLERVKEFSRKGGLGRSKDKALNHYIEKLSAKGHKVKILKDAHKTPYRPSDSSFSKETGGHPKAVLEVDGEKRKVYYEGFTGRWGR